MADRLRYQVKVIGFVADPARREYRIVRATWPDIGREIAICKEERHADLVCRALNELPEPPPWEAK